MDRPARLFRGPRNGEVLSLNNPTFLIAEALEQVTPSILSETMYPVTPSHKKGRYELRVRHGHPVVLKDGNYAFDWQGWDAPPKPAKKPAKIQGKKFTLKMVDDAYAQHKVDHSKWLEEWHMALKANVIKQISNSAPLFKDITSA